MAKPLLYMAPMKGFTDHLFRKTFAENFTGFDLAIAPFISSKSDRRFKRKYVKDVLPENNTRMRVVPQILSKAADDFAALANYLYDLDYHTVNWNVGCPYPMVANKKRGAGLLPHTEMIAAFLDHAVPLLTGNLSIKVRLGWHSADDIFRLIPILNQYPLEELIIHPRTGIQRYNGAVDLGAFEQSLLMINHPVVYNGDIKTFEDFTNLSQRFAGVNRWMIGRGCLANPFLPLIIKTGKDDIPDKIEKMKQFHQDLFEAYGMALNGPSHLLNKMKGFWRYFSLPFIDCDKSVKKIRKSRRPDQYLELVNRFFDMDAKLP